MVKAFPFMLAILAVVAMTIIANPAHAQQPPMEDVPDAYIEEAMAYYDTCLGRQVMQEYYDCKCLSVKFLDKRIEVGPYTPKEEIAISLLKECRDSVNAAGPAYQECLNTASTMKPGTDPEVLCSCVGNTYAKLMARDAPVIDSRSIVRYKSMARIMCEDPTAAQRLGLVPP